MPSEAHYEWPASSRSRLDYRGMRFRAPAPGDIHRVRRLHSRVSGKRLPWRSRLIKGGRMRGGPLRRVRDRVRVRPVCTGGEPMSTSTTSCAQCGIRIDLSKPHLATDGPEWCSTMVGCHGKGFCSMECADDWEMAPANTDLIAESHRKANCSSYLSCVCDALMADLYPKRPPLESCEAECPLRSARGEGSAQP